MVGWGGAGGLASVAFMDRCYDTHCRTVRTTAWYQELGKNATLIEVSLCHACLPACHFRPGPRGGCSPKFQLLIVLGRGSLNHPMCVKA